MDLDFTDFSGNILDSVGNLQSMEGLRLGGCCFSRPIPVGNLTQLRYLSVASNMFNNSGDLSWPHKLTKLTWLDLKHTNLYGDMQ